MQRSNRMNGAFLLALAGLVLLGSVASALQMKQVGHLPWGPCCEYPVVCGDFNGNGRNEVAFHTNTGLGGSRMWQVWELDSTGSYWMAYGDSFTSGVGIRSGLSVPMALGDFDRDGQQDMLSRNTLLCDTVHEVYYNVFTIMESPHPDSYPTRLVFYDTLNQLIAEGGTYYYADLDQDEYPEIVINRYNRVMRQILIYECVSNNRAELRWIGDLETFEVACADFDLDGRIELATVVTMDSGSEVATVECTGDNQYWIPPWRDTTVYFNGTDIFTGDDVDRNGKPEFFVRCKEYRGAWNFRLDCYEATGDNTYESYFVDSVHCSGAWSSSECGDVDGDGIEEVVWAAGDRVHIYKATAPHTFEREFVWWNPGTIRVAVFDLNGNGYGETVFGAYDTDIFEVEAIRVHQPNGGELFSAGDTCVISWEKFVPPQCDSISLFYRTSTSVYNLDTIATGIYPGDTMYRWVVPDINSGTVRVQAIAYGRRCWQYDASDEPFTIGVPGIGESGGWAWRNWNPPTMLRGVLRVPVGVSAVMLDATGRRVAGLLPGVNDLSGLAPGVYFIRAEGSRGQGSEGQSRKVVIQR